MAGRLLSLGTQAPDLSVLGGQKDYLKGLGAILTQKYQFFEYRRYHGNSIRLDEVCSGRMHIWLI